MLQSSGAGQFNSTFGSFQLFILGSPDSRAAHYGPTMPLIGATVRFSAAHITECRLWGLNGWGALSRSSNGSFMHGKEFESDRVETGFEF